MGAKYLEDGEKREMRPSSYLGPERNKVKVIAERIDAETPYVILEFEGKQFYMTDVLAQDVSARILRALTVLPTSK